MSDSQNHHHPAADGQPTASPPPSAPDAATAHGGLYTAPPETHRDLQSVARGLDLIYFGIAIVVLSLIGTLVMPYLSSALDLDTLLRILKFLMLGLLAGALMGLIGRILCLKVPSSSGGKPFIISSVVCDVLSIISTVVLLLGSREGGILAAGQNILPIAAALLFLLFLKRTASFIGSGELAGRAQSLFVMTLILAVAGTFSVMFLLALLVGLPILAVLALLLLITFLRYIRLIYDLRRAILQAIA